MKPHEKVKEDDTISILIIGIIILLLQLIFHLSVDAKSFSSQDSIKSELNIQPTVSAMSDYTKQKFILKTPVPILITYLTTTIEDGLLVRHDDVYKLDKILMLECIHN